MIETISKETRHADALIDKRTLNLWIVLEITEHYLFIGGFQPHEGRWITEEILECDYIRLLNRRYTEFWRYKSLHIATSSPAYILLAIPIISALLVTITILLNQ